MRRSTSIRLVAAGAVVSGLLGSGLLAATSDSVSSTGNTVTSGVYTGPVVPAHNVQVGRVHFSTGDCATATYSDGPTTFITLRNVDADDPFSASGQGADDLCVKNVGTTTGRLIFTVGNVLDTEVGTCEASEAAADGGNDTTCSSGDAGELSSVLRIAYANPKAGSAAACQNGAFTTFDAARTTGQVIAAALAPGEICRIGGVSTLLQSDLTEEQKKISQTDRVQYDAVFSLRD